MKKTVFIAILFTAAIFTQTVKAQTEAQRIELCTKVAGEATLEKSYTCQLAAADDGGRAPTFKQAVAMRKGNKFRFTICTDEESSGEAILQLYDEAKMIGSSYSADTGKTYQNFDFECNKTAVYVIIISIKDGKDGSAVGIVSHVKTL